MKSLQYVDVGWYGYYMVYNLYTKTMNKTDQRRPYHILSTSTNINIQ